MVGIGRKRKHDRHLPQRVYHRHGAFYYVDCRGKWHRLAKRYDDALCQLATLVERNTPAHTFEQLANKYVAEELGRLALKTRRGRLQEFKKLKAVFGHMHPGKLEPHDVFNYWKERGRTEQARHEVRALSMLLTYGRRIGVVKRENVAFGLRLPASPPRRRYVTHAEYELVRSVAQPMIRHAMGLAYYAGMDQATIRRLERGHLTDEGIQFERGKTGVLQLIGWSDELRTLVDAIKREPPELRRVLICNRRGRAYSANGFQSQWQRTLRKAALAGLAEPFHFHDLRAKSASDALSDQEAADRLGHGDAQLTRRVYRRLPRKATALQGAAPKGAKK